MSIIGILDNNLNQIVSYKYDSWGKPISITDTDGQEITNQNNIGIINPYRYHSYRYDTETGLYYLQSRYYNPEWGRFLNGDNELIQNSELLGNNLYAYCMNNPINLKDPNGNFAISTIVNAIKNTTKKVVQVVAKVTLKIPIPDYTRQLKGVLIANAYEIISDKEWFGGETMALSFYHAVNTKGPWDYKLEESWNRSIRVPFPKQNKFVFNGNLITAEDFGNINYGFTGTAAGFSPEILFMGGGYANFNHFDLRILIGPNYGDDANDHYYIQYGIDLYYEYF